MFKREYTIIMKDPKTNSIPYVWKGTSLQESYAWLDSVTKKEKFKGLEPIRSSRLLFMNKSIKLAQAVLWLNVILAIILIFKLASI